MITMETRKIRVKDVTETLRDEIVLKAMAPDTAIMSTREISESFGVSPITANRAVMKLVEEGLLYRVKGSGTFVRGSVPCGLKGCVALLIADHVREDSVLNYYLRNIYSYFKKEQVTFRIVFFSELWDTANAERKLKEFDGIVMPIHIWEEKTIPALRSFGKPIVAFQTDQIREDIPVHQVMFNLRMGYAEALARMDGTESKKFHLFSEAHANGLARTSLFEQMLLEAGAQKENIGKTVLNGGEDVALECYRMTFRLSEKLRGKFVFSSSDFHIAVPLINAMDDRGLKAGTDYELMSCDNMEGHGCKPFARPRITAIDCDKGASADAAAGLLMSLIGKPSSAQHIVRIPTKLVMRETAFCRK